MLSHPLWAIALLSLTLLLGSGLLRAIARLLEQLWLGLFRAPLSLGQWLLNFVFRRSTQGGQASSHSGAQAKLQALLQRWEQLQTSQAALLAEFKQLLATLPVDGTPPTSPS